MRPHQDPPGMGEKFWAERKAVAECRMAAVDASPRLWRDLVHEFGLEAARMGWDAETAQRLLAAKRG